METETLVLFLILGLAIIIVVVIALCYFCCSKKDDLEDDTDKMDKDEMDPMMGGDPPMDQPEPAMDMMGEWDLSLKETIFKLSKAFRESGPNIIFDNY